MNTLSIPASVSAARVPTSADSYIFVSSGMAAVRPPVDWLPVPASPVKPAGKVRARSTGRYGPVAREPVMPRLMFGLLSGAAVLGVAYGFSCLVDLVQHWAVFDAGITQLIQ